MKLNRLLKKLGGFTVTFATSVEFYKYRQMFTYCINKVFQINYFKYFPNIHPFQSSHCRVNEVCSCQKYFHSVFLKEKPFYMISLTCHNFSNSNSEYHLQIKIFFPSHSGKTCGQCYTSEEWVADEIHKWRSICCFL